MTKYRITLLTRYGHRIVTWLSGDDPIKQLSWVGIEKNFIEEIVKYDDEKRTVNIESVAAGKV